LARLDVDPLIEAAELAQMSTGAAIDRLSARLSELDLEGVDELDDEEIATRLIKLLPPRRREVAAARHGRIGYATSPGRSIFPALLLLSIYLLFAFALSAERPARAPVSRAADHVGTTSNALPVGGRQSTHGFAI
jgi:hypothetical protein